jgi:arylsulfatase A-like enzyme
VNDPRRPRVMSSGRVGNGTAEAETMAARKRRDIEDKSVRGLTRREFLRTVGIGGVAVAAAGMLPNGVSALLSGDAVARRKPNIIVILADDLGYADLGCQGCKDIPTPNIDSLAKNGVRFTDAYVSCPVCSPTRAGLMTGRYQERFGHEFNPGPAQAASATFGLPKTEKTIAERLKALGYVTGMVGKWHLGNREGYRPTERGFDEFFGFLAGSHPYLKSGLKSSNPIMRGTEPIEETEYLTDAFNREAAAFIENHRDEPFFLYLPYNAVHTPMQASAKREERFKRIADKRRRTFATMLAAIDDGVGDLLRKLRDHDIEDNTLIFFFSDNGGPTNANTSRNDPLSGYKAQVFEGGIRVPFIVQWKSRLPKGKVCKELAIALDILPTAIVAAGGKIAPDWKLDGVDLAPYLTGAKTGPVHRRLYWRFGEQRAIRAGDWKLMRQSDGDTYHLYNLADDIGEKKDLAEKMPERAKELKAAYDEWNSHLAKPAWTPNAPARRRAG